MLNTATIPPHIPSHPENMITAIYNGDANYSGGSGTLSGGQTVNELQTSTRLTPSDSTPAYSQTITSTAAVAETTGNSRDYSTGNVQFMSGNSSIGLRPSPPTTIQGFGILHIYGQLPGR